MQDMTGTRRVDAALAAMAADYAAAPAARNMLILLAAIIVPLLVLILMRLLDKVLPSAGALAVSVALGLVLLGAVAEMAFGALRIAPAGIERHSPWFWRSWRVPRQEIEELRMERTGKGRYLVVAMRGGGLRRVPFRPGFAAGAALLEGGPGQASGG
ncbi:MAG TPA: hypothetical protein PKD29_05685 [Rhodocyclaceae bacterium]|nr:hypothetical protein [Rhodocyclaceae bacterium]